MDCVDILIQEQRLFEVSYTAEIKALWILIHIAMWDVQVLYLQINSNYFFPSDSLQTQRTWFPVLQHLDKRMNLCFNPHPSTDVYFSRKICTISYIENILFSPVTLLLYLCFSGHICTLCLPSLLLSYLSFHYLLWFAYSIDGELFLYASPLWCLLMRHLWEQPHCTLLAFVFHVHVQLFRALL